MQRAISLATRARIYVRDGGICHICGIAVPRENAAIDHVIPLSRGGTHSEENWKLAHRSCNTLKSTKLMTEICVINGTVQRKKHAAAMVPIEVAQEIRQRHRAGEDRATLARALKLPHAIIQAIIRGPERKPVS